MKAVKALRDDDGHWYIVPNDEANEFMKLFDDIIANDYDCDLIDKFEEKFSKYRTGGDLNNVQLYIED